MLLPKIPRAATYNYLGVDFVCEQKNNMRNTRTNSKRYTKLLNPVFFV